MPQSPRTVLFTDYNAVQAILSGHSLITLVKHLDPARYRPAVIFNRASDIETILARLGVPTAIVPHGGGNLLKKAWQFGTLPIHLRRLARRIRPDLIHANNVMASRSAMMLRTLTGKPTIVQIRNTGVLPRGAGWIWKADHLAPVSKATLVGTVPQALQNKSTIVGDGLEIMDYPVADASRRRAIRQSLRLPVDAQIVGMAGRITAQKGIRYFVEAAKAITDARPDVIFVHIGKSNQPDASGEQNYENMLMQSTRELCASGKFVWLGYTNSMNDFWAAVDIAVVPSSGPEAFGRVVIEAMAAERPVIATMCGGPEDIITPDTGMLIPIAHSQKLSEAIVHWLDHPDQRLRVGAAGRLRVETVFSAQAYADRMMSMFDAVLEQHV